MNSRGGHRQWKTQTPNAKIAQTNFTQMACDAIHSHSASRLFLINLERYLRYLRWIMVATLLFGPASMLGLVGGKNASFYVLLLCGFIALLGKASPTGMTFIRALREMWPFALAMASTVIAIALHDISTGTFSSRIYDMPSRLAVFPLMTWSLLLLTHRQLKAIYVGMAFGAIVGAIALTAATHNGDARPAVVFLMPLIPFGNLTFMMGAIAALSIGMHKPQERGIIGLKALAGGAALWAAYLSQTRGAWLVLVVGVPFWLARQRRMSGRLKLGLLCVFIIGVLGMYFFGDILKSRIFAGYSDLSLYLSGMNPDTSLGIRLQLWKASWLIFERHPIIGIGIDHYTDGLAKMAAEGVITPEAATFHHAHNDLLFSMATLGLVGLISTLSIYLVPAWAFLKAMRVQDREAKIAAESGFYIVFFFFVFGLTEVMFFYWTPNHAFYSFILAALYAHAWRRKLDIEFGDKHAASKSELPAFG